MYKNIIRKSVGEQIFLCLNNAVLFMLGFATLLPFYIVIVNSVSPPEDFLFKEIIIWPSKLDLQYYKVVLGKGSTIYNAYKITAFLATAGTFISLAITTITAYVLAQRKLPFRSLLTLFMVFTMYFSGGMIPAYLVVRYLNLIDTVWAMIIPGMIGTYNMLLMRNFIMGIPGEIIEAATIDGCSELCMIIKIILPISTASMATIGLFYAVQYWNTFSGGVLYINSAKLRPLQVYLHHILNQATLQNDFKELGELMQQGRYKPPSEAVQAATIMSATLPIIFVYPFVQKYFVKGITVGSLKG